MERQFCAVTIQVSRRDELRLEVRRFRRMLQLVSPVMPPRSAKSQPPPWLRPLLLTIAAILLLALFSGEIRDTDIWLHLKTGQHTLQTRALTVPDPFSYTSGMGRAKYAGEEVTRYFNLTHEWLAQIAMYLIYAVSGFGGLVQA